MGPERVEENAEKEPAEKNALEEGVKRADMRVIQAHRAGNIIIQN